MGRSTFGQIYNQHHQLARLIAKEPLAFDYLGDYLDHILSPAMFELLCVSLLNLIHKGRDQNHPQQHWLHVGGVGDDSMDGLGFDAEGQPIGGLQCKLALGSNEPETLAKKFQGELQQNHVCWFTSSTAPNDTATTTYWDRKKIISLTTKYAAALPFLPDLQRYIDRGA